MSVPKCLILTAILLSCISLTLAQDSPSYRPAETTEEMVSACRGIANADVVNDGTVRMKDTAENGLCWGYFSTFPIIISTTYNLHYGTSPTYPLRVCVKGGITVNQIIAIFMEYAKRHPERYTHDAFLVEIDALKEAFPCAVGRK